MFRRMDLRQLRAGASCAIGCSLLMTGCATIGLGEPLRSDHALKTTRVEVPSDDVPFVEVDQVGTEVALNAKKRCRVEERKSVRRTTTRSVRTSRPPRTGRSVLSGAGAAGLGTGVILDASGATMIGVGLVAVVRRQRGLARTEVANDLRRPGLPASPPTKQCPTPARLTAVADPR